MLNFFIASDSSCYSLKNIMNSWSLRNQNGGVGIYSLLSSCLQADEGACERAAHTRFTFYLRYLVDWVVPSALDR